MFVVHDKIPSLAIRLMTDSEYNYCVDKFADGVYRFVLKCIGDSEKARDIVQDSFEKMWTKRGGIEGNKAKSYLFSTAYHTMIDYQRKEKRILAVDDISIFDDSVCSNNYSDLKEILDSAIVRLPEIQRSVLLLRDYEGYSYQEIGEITRLNESQVKVYIYRARIALKNYIGKVETLI